MRNRKIAKEILQMAKLDQEARKSFIKGASFWERVEEIDMVNLAKMKRIIGKFGWPTITLVGKKASHMAWLLIQHADRDVKFQEYCLELMKKEVEIGEFTKTNLAFLTDRILINKGKSQIYGTQFYESKGKLIPRPVKNADKLNERREKMGLEQFEDYEKRLRASSYKARTDQNDVTITHGR